MEETLFEHDGILPRSPLRGRHSRHQGGSSSLGKARVLKRNARPATAGVSDRLFFEDDRYQFMPLGAPGFADRRGCRILGWDYKEADNGWDVARWVDGAVTASHGKKSKGGIESKWFTGFQSITGGNTPPLYAGFIKGVNGHDLSIAQDQNAYILFKSLSTGTVKRLPIRIHEVYYGKSDFFHSMTDGMPQAHSKASGSAHVLYSITPQAAESLAFEAADARR